MIDGLYQDDLTIAIAGIEPSLIPLVLVDLTVPEPSSMLAGGGALLSLGLLARRRVGGVRAPRTQTPVAALQPLIAPSIRRFTENRES